MTSEEIKELWQQDRMAAFSFPPFAEGGYYRTVKAPPPYALEPEKAVAYIATFKAERGPRGAYRVLGRHDGDWIEVERGRW